MKYIRFIKLFTSLLWSKWNEARIGLKPAYQVSYNIHLKK